MKFKPLDRIASPTSIGKNWAAFGQLLLRNIGGSFQCYSDLTGEDSARLRKMLEMLAAVTPKDVDYNDDTIRAHVLHTFCFAQWAEENYNTFDVTSSLLAGLLMTEPNHEPALLNLPFRAFHVRLPSGFIPIQVTTDSGSEVRWIKRIMVNRYSFVDASDGSTYTILRVLGSDDSAQIPDVSINIDEREFTSVADQMKDVEAEMIGAVTTGGGIDPNDAIAGVEDGRTQSLIFLVVANLCGWLESIGGLGGRKPDNALKRERKPDEEAKITQWIVGREVKLAPEITQSAKDLAQHPRKRVKGWHLSYQCSVRGHLRWQACGPEQKQRKRIWVQPHRRGPKSGDVVAHIYKVSSENDARKPKSL